MKRNIDIEVAILEETKASLPPKGDKEDKDYSTYIL